MAGSPWKGILELVSTLLINLFSVWVCIFNSPLSIKLYKRLIFKKALKKRFTI